MPLTVAEGRAANTNTSASIKKPLIETSGFLKPTLREYQAA